ncbi:hypothetical protein, partial [Nocardia sp. NPDC004722]
HHLAKVMRYQLRYIRVLTRPCGPIGLRDRTLAYGWVVNANRLENRVIRGWGRGLETEKIRRWPDLVPTPP